MRPRRADVASSSPSSDSSASDAAGAQAAGASKRHANLPTEPMEQRRVRNPRAESLASSTQDTDEERTESAHRATAPVKKRKRKYRKGTHTIRKEEIATLQKEITALQMQVEALRTSALPVVTAEGEVEHDQQYREKVFSNRLLRRALRQQQNRFAPTHALMTQYTFWEAEGGSPLHQFIHLGNDEPLRRAALNGMKTAAIVRSRQFLRKRWPHFEPWRPMKQEYFFESSNGDYMGLSLATMQFRAITSVKRAFDSVLTFFNNMEISVSEQFGSITIREDNDSLDTGIAQNRLVTTSPSGQRMESNTVFFSCFYERDSGWGDQPEHGVVMCDYVDLDARYPYHSQDRIRRDMCAVVEVKASTVRDGGDERETIVLTRWVQTKLHRPAFELPSDHWDELCDKMERWVHIVQPSLLETLV